MLKFTLDTNCQIAVDESREGVAPFVKQLLAAAERGSADVAMVFSSASERQRDHSYLDNATVFIERMQRLGFGHVPLLKPILRWDMGFWDGGVVGSAEGSAREALIYRTMFPKSAVEWKDYAATANVDLNDDKTPAYKKWRNQLLDAQAYRAHDFNDRDVFVTTDTEFCPLEGHLGFPKAVIRHPKDAAGLL
jgi:hypothetical protein